MINKKKILITWRLMIDYMNNYESLLHKNNLTYDVIYKKQGLGEKDLINVIHKYDGIICGDDEINKNVLKKAKKLKVISKWGSGIDSIDSNYAKQKNIKILNSPGAFTEPVAQHAMGLMLSLTRNIVANHLDLKKGIWSKRINQNIYKKKIGIIGFGKIGKEIKKILKIFSPKFYLCDKKYKSKNFVSKDVLIKNADIIFICCDLNPTSKHLIGMRELKKMKKNAFLINISRGAIIKNIDLIKALKRNIISGAGIDVFEKEPILKNSEFLKLSNCILSSHNAFNSEDAIININNKSIYNILNFFKIYK